MDNIIQKPSSEVFAGVDPVNLLFLDFITQIVSKLENNCVVTSHLTFVTSEWCLMMNRGLVHIFMKLKVSQHKKV